MSEQVKGALIIGGAVVLAAALWIYFSPFEQCVPSSSAGPLQLYDDNGNGRITCAEARRHGIAPVARSHPAYRYMNDRDNDGVVCE